MHSAVTVGPYRKEVDIPAFLFRIGGVYQDVNSEIVF